MIEENKEEYWVKLITLAHILNILKLFQKELDHKKTKSREK